MKDVVITVLLLFFIWVWANPHDAVEWYETLTGVPV